MGKTAMLFPGQGSQFIGMGKKAFDSHASAAKLLSQANEILGFDLGELMFNGPEEKLQSTDITQPALFVSSMMSFSAIKEKDMEFHFTAGHSLGEYSALCAAQALDFSAALELVKMRGELMAKAGESQPGAMSAILGLSREEIEKSLASLSAENIVVVANHNSLNQIVISGDKQGVAKAGELLSEAGAKKVIPLKVGGAFHSPLMQKAVEPFADKLNSTQFKKPIVPIVTNVEALPCDDPDKLRELLVKQLLSPVRWVEIVQSLVANGCDSAYEIGAGKVLMGLARGIDRSLKVKPVESSEDIAQEKVA